MPRIRKSNRALSNLAKTARNVRQGLTLAATAGQVIAARGSRQNDAAEMTRMVSEKMTAANSVGLIFMRHALEMSMGFWTRTPMMWWSDLLRAQYQMTVPVQQIAGANVARLRR